MRDFKGFVISLFYKVWCLLYYTDLYLIFFPISLHNFWASPLMDVVILVWDIMYRLHFSMYNSYLTHRIMSSFLQILKYKNYDSNQFCYFHCNIGGKLYVILCSTCFFFRYGWEPVLILRISIVLGAILKKNSLITESPSSKQWKKISHLCRSGDIS